MKKKRKLKLWVINTIRIFFLLIAIYSGYKIFVWIKSINENKDIKQKISEKLDISIDGTKNEKGKYNIDFSSLKKENPDIVGYIKVNNTNIDYVVVKGKDNSYYLTHNLYKNYNVAGWIFADYRNKFDDTDRNTIIYGHNMKDGSMFGTLNGILNKEWFENKDNYTIIFVTEKDTYYYKIFSTYSIVPEEYYISTNFESDNEFGEFVNVLKDRSVFDYGVEVTGKDKIITLSSCIGDGKKRVVLHAKFIGNSIE